MIENYISKEESKKDVFVFDNKKISLREYQKDLVFYWSGEEEQAEYALVNSSPEFTKAPTICQNGRFGNYSRIESPIKFDDKNLESLTDNIHLSFYLGTNVANGYYSTTFTKKNSDNIPAGDYSLKIQVDGEINKNLIINLKKDTTFLEFKNKLMFLLDPKKYNVKLLDDTETSFTLSSAFIGRKVKYSDGQDGTSLLNIFEITEESNGTYPTKDMEVLSLVGETSSLKILHVNANSRSKLRFVFSQGEISKTTTVDWNNDAINLDNIEVDIDSSVMYIFINGKLVKAVLISPIVKNQEKMQLILGGSEEDPYSFEEIIIKNKLQNKEDFTPSISQLTKYDTTIPYIDFYFLTNNISKKNIKEFNINASENISMLLNYDGIYYYYKLGSWRKSDASLTESNNKYDFQDNIKNFEFSENKDLFIRVLFESNGKDPSWLENIFFDLSDEDILGDGKLTPAILVGENQFKEDEILNLKDKTLIIKTDIGNTEIKFEEDMPIDKAAEYIKEKYPEGIAEVKVDSLGRLVLISDTKGPEAYIQTNGDAGFLLFGKENSAQGDDTDKNSLDEAYKKFLEKVYNYINDDLIPTEISDESIRLYLQEAINLYKRYRSEEINTYEVQLNGNPKDGYEIPPVIEDWHDITDIIFKPIFPISFYTGFGDMEDVATLTLLNVMMGKGAADYGNFYGKNFTQDYYISLMNIQDMNQTLGLNPQWHVYNNRLYIFPNNVSKYLSVNILYKAPVDPNKALKDPFIIQYVAGKIRMAQSEVRGQFGGALSAGQNVALTFNASEMYERGKQLCDQALEELKKLQGPLGFFFG